jgi:hypothetical protein
MFGNILKGVKPMLLMQQHQDGLRRRLRVIGIPVYTIEPFIRLMVTWESCSGVEWTIKRLKGLKVDLIRAQTGLPSLTWIRKNRKGQIAGTIGSIFRWSLSKEENFAKGIQAFMAYTFYILSGMTKSQREKFLSGIGCSEPDGLSELFHKQFRETVVRAVRRRSISCSGRPLVTYRGSPDKKAPNFFGRKSVPQCDKILNDLSIFNNESGMVLYLKYHDLYSPLLKGLGDHRRYLEDELQHWKQSGRSLPNVPVRGGEIHFIQEPGGKLRSVASPFRIHQEALRPFGEELYRLIQSLPWDCTYDQTRAIPHIQSHLWQGGQVHSVDLSSATDYFPLSIQLTALRAIFSESDWPHINLFEEISRGKWSSVLGDLQWKRGQPLGLYPSFASFTLTHGLLLLHLANGDYHHQFFVVGDDVVILEDNLRDKYINMLDRMGCPWSEDKSLSSNRLAEFAGKIVTSSKVIPQLKWRRMSNDNFLDICRLLGSKSYCLLNKRQKAVFQSVAHLCEPIGLNFSLPGDNLEKMVERTVDFYQPVEVVLGALLGLRRKINHLVYSSGTIDFNSSELEEIVLTFDEKVKSVLAQTIFTNWDFVLSLGREALETIPEALGIKPRLPLKEREPTRLTTLDRYERLVLSHKSRA